ncbi:hypothetical protein M514_01978 [Trichuris suis]|uniref:Uncharacterized protein n=1 Tax=Trichuris suis TaxID=68888 RepID=A0A085NJG8_9BILA|nr:hypothetical protein M513_01978 [Trichuris suis]KFD69614.1 hypothetical protein M514_01978 [Trichuris suis]
MSLQKNQTPAMRIERTQDPRIGKTMIRRTSFTLLTFTQRLKKISTSWKAGLAVPQLRKHAGKLVRSGFCLQPWSLRSLVSQSDAPYASCNYEGVTSSCSFQKATGEPVCIA